MSNNKQITMAQQTAVEWLIEQLKDGVKYNPLQKNGYSNAEKNLFEQAKEMEKQQMFDYIKKNYVNGEHSLKFHKEVFEQYYKETYKK